MYKRIDKGDRIEFHNPENRTVHVYYKTWANPRKITVTKKRLVKKSTKKCDSKK